MSQTQYLFDWGNTLMADLPDQNGPMSTWPTVRAMPDAYETLLSLSAQFPCHLATNALDSSVHQIREALWRVDLDSFITNIYCYNTVRQPKPSAAFFEHILKDLQCPPTDLIMIGDVLEKDIRGAQANGLQAIWYNPGRHPIPEGITAITDLLELVPNHGV